jgi:hypothetical protein
VDGPEILVASMSLPTPRGKTKAPWQYHSRSDLHSKVGSWGVLFDLLQASRVLRGHAQQGKVIFGVNFEMRDFGTGRKKRLDLVVARPSSDVTKSKPQTLSDLARAWSIVLTPQQQTALASLPPLYSGPVGAVLVALEAKAAMTAHTKALPRLYDELNSSHLTVHGASRGALAVGLAMVNVSTTFVSPDLNDHPPGTPGQQIVVSQHAQPGDAAGVIAKVREIPRRTATQAEGYDGLGVIVVEAPNDGVTPVKLVTVPPAPPVGDVLHYDTMVTRVANEYDRVFRGI